MGHTVDEACSTLKQEIPLRRFVSTVVLLQEDCMLTG